MSFLSKLPRAPQDGLVAAVLLSFLATAGLFYVNVMPALIEGLINGLGYSTRTAGLVGSANVYGAAAGALLAAFLVRRLPWRPVVVTLLFCLIVIDLFSTAIVSAPLLICVRAVHGFTGGLLVGFGFAVIARTRRPERTFGMLLIVQFGLGGLGVMFLPRLAESYGTPVLFLALLAFSAVTLLMIPWLGAYPERAAATTQTQSGSLRQHALPLGLALLAVFLFQAANMALFSFIIGLARHYGLDGGFASSAVGASTWVGIAGSVLVITLSIRFGRLIPLTLALALTAIGFWLLHFSSAKLLFVLANCGTAVTWAFVMPHLLGSCSEFDDAGRAAAFAGFASKMGMASGPLAGALLLGDAGHYDLLIDLSILGIVACAGAAFVPARLLDRQARAPVPRRTLPSAADAN